MDSREEFENHPRFKGMDFTRSATHPMYYESPYANGAWDGWCAATEAPCLPFTIGRCANKHCLSKAREISPYCEKCEPDL